MNMQEFLKEIDPDAGWYLPSTVYEYSGLLRDRRYQCPLCSVANKKFWKMALNFLNLLILKLCWQQYIWDYQEKMATF